MFVRLCRFQQGEPKSASQDPVSMHSTPTPTDTHTSNVRQTHTFPGTPRSLTPCVQIPPAAKFNGAERGEGSGQNLPQRILGLKTSKTPEGRSATFKVQGLVFLFYFFIFLYWGAFQPQLLYDFFSQKKLFEPSRGVGVKKKKKT